MDNQLHSKLSNLIGTKFVHRSGSYDESRLTQSRVICLYFCAKWCPPCRTFNPLLVEFYNDINIQKHQLEIIFVSKDKDEYEFKDYLQEMPWLAIPYSDKSRIDNIISHFKQETIPALYVLDFRGNDVSREGRQDVLKYGSDCFVKWVGLVEKAVEEESKEN